jgi:hypothetical protein
LYYSPPTGKRSSIKQDLPIGKFTTGFTNNSLLTAGEKVGIIFALFVCLGMNEGDESLVSSVVGRIQEKYVNVPLDSDLLRKRGDVHFFSDMKQGTKSKRNKPMSRTKVGVINMVKLVVSHNLSFILDHHHNLDELQSEYFLTSVHKILDCSSASSLKFPDIDRICLSDRELQYANALYTHFARYPTITQSISTCIETPPRAKRPPTKTKKTLTTKMDVQ